MVQLIRVAAILLTTGALGGCQPRGGMPSADVASDAERIRALSRQLVDAEARKDIDATLAFYAEDAVNQPPSLPAAQGREAIRRLYEDFYRAVPFVAFTGTITAVHVARAGDLAYETGINRFVMDNAGVRAEDVGKYLTVWRKIEGEWRVVAISFSSDRPAR